MFTSRKSKAVRASGRMPSARNRSRYVLGCSRLKTSACKSSCLLFCSELVLDDGVCSVAGEGAESVLIVVAVKKLELTFESQRVQEDNTATIYHHVKIHGHLEPTSLRRPYPRAPFNLWQQPPSSPYFLVVRFISFLCIFIYQPGFWECSDSRTRKAPGYESYRH